MKNAGEWIECLGLTRHPEGGWFRETYRADGVIPASALPPRYTCDHPFSTAIYYLLGQGDFSAFHGLASDETWHFHAGAPLSVYVLDPGGTLSTIVLGAERFQATVKAGDWFAARVESNAPGAFALVGCTVAPGFLSEDFELADRGRLLAEYPQHREVIESLTRAG